MSNTHAQRLERWFGVETVERLSRSMRGWYGPPIPLAGVPGAVYACGDGDFRGPIEAGAFCSVWDAVEARFRSLPHPSSSLRNVQAYSWAPRRSGLDSLSHMVNQATKGDARNFPFTKVGTTRVVSGANSLWRVGATPSAGAAGAAAPGGTTFTSATTGAFQFVNPSGKTQHFTTGFPYATQQGTLLLYDRLFAVAVNMNSTATQAVTGVPTRYQSTTAGDMESAEGNFLFFETGTALAATAHNWTVCTYANQAGSGQNLPSVAGNASNIANRLDLPLGFWFAPLNGTHTGVQKLTQVQLSAAVATGTADAVIGHPIAWMPVPIANLMVVMDGVNSAFGVNRVLDNAALALLEVCCPNTTATTYGGMFSTVSG